MIYDLLFMIYYLLFIIYYLLFIIYYLLLGGGWYLKNGLRDYHH